MKLITEAGYEIEISAAEFKVMELIAEGYSSREIGQKLFISPKTVEVHRYNLLKKSQCRNILHLVALMFRQGLFKM